MHKFLCRLALAIFTLGVVCWLSPVCVYAESAVVTFTELSTTEMGYIKSFCDETNTKVISDKDCNMTKKIFSYTSSGDTLNVYFNSSDYNRLSTNEKIAVMEIVVDKLERSNISTIYRTKMYNFISKNDETTANHVRQLSKEMKADYTRAYLFLRPFSTPFGVVLGVATILIFVSLTFSIVIDLSFLTIPILQCFILGSDTETKPKFISIEAWNALKFCESASKSNEHKSLVGVYFSKKTKELIAISICLLYLVSGKIFDLVASLMNMFNGVVR